MHPINKESVCCHFVFKGVVWVTVYGGVSGCGFPVNVYVYCVVMSG